MSVVQSDLETSRNLQALLQEGSDKLVWSMPKLPILFRFNWEQIQFSGRLNKVDNGHRLLLLGDLGPLPFTAERPNFRERLLNLLAWEAKGERVKFVLEPVRHRIYLMIDDILGEEFSGPDLVSSTIRSLLHAKPFIELAKEVGWQHPTDVTPKDFNVTPADMEKPTSTVAEQAEKEED